MPGSPTVEAVPQPEDGVTYAAKIEKAEARIDFTRSAVEVERQVRAFNPLPGAFFECRGERIKVHRGATIRRWRRAARARCSTTSSTIACAEGCDPADARPARRARAAMSAEELLRGFPIPPGTRLA